MSVEGKWLARTATATGTPLTLDFDTEEEWVSWMHTKAVRKDDGTGREPTVGVTPDGREWVQLGYVLVPKDEDDG